MTVVTSWIMFSLLFVWNDQVAHGFNAVPTPYQTRTLQYAKVLRNQKRHRKLSTAVATAPFYRKTTTTAIGAASKAAANVATAAAPGVSQSIISTTKITKKLAKKSIVKGKLSTVLSKFLISPRRYFEIFKKVFINLTDSWNDLADITLILVCLKVPLPLARYLYGKRPGKSKIDPELLEKQFLRSKTRKIAESVHEFGFLLTFLYFVEIALFVLDELKFKFVHQYPVHSWTAGIVISIWTAKCISALKYYALSNGGTIDISNKSEIRLFNRVADIFIYSGTVFAIFDFLPVEFGFALKSIFGLSSFATLVFSLASKELAQEFLASLAIQGTNMYSEGEKIMLKDGTVGNVQKLGWMNTHIRRSDELVVRIPNTQISNQRLANISRTKLSSVQQSIAIDADSIDTVTKFTEDIKSEVRKNCPTLVDDLVESKRGSRRKFRVFWTNYKENSLEVIVDAKFTTTPKCDDYYAIRQQVLLSLSRAAKKNNIQFKYIKSDNIGTTLLD